MRLEPRARCQIIAAQNQVAAMSAYAASMAPGCRMPYSGACEIERGHCLACGAGTDWHGADSRYTAVYRAPMAPGSDRSIYEQAVTASDWREALAIATREAQALALDLVALAVGAPDGFTDSIRAAGIER